MQKLTNKLSGFRDLAAVAGVVCSIALVLVLTREVLLAIERQQYAD